MFYKHNLENLGVKYSFSDILSNLKLKDWSEEVKKPDKRLLEILNSLDLGKKYGEVNGFMEDKSEKVNKLFFKEIPSFLSEEKHGKSDTKYFMDFLGAHFSREKHVRVLLVQMIGRILLNAQNSEAGLEDNLKIRKLINADQLKTWDKTLDYFSLATEILNAASYTADDSFDKTESRYGVATTYKKHGDFAGTISADILFHYLGNYIFYKTIREHEKGVEVAYLTDSGKVSVNDNPYSLKWQDKKTDTYVYINPEQYMDVWEVWSWAWYMINSGQIRDLYEFKISNISNFNIESYIARAYRLSGGFIECMAHLSCAFTGCGYWEGRQNIGKWAAIYGTMTQIRNDFYDYVTYTVEGSKHQLIKDTHEDVSLGRVTLPLGVAYSKASKSDKEEMVKVVNSMINQKEKGSEINIEERLKLNNLIEKNGGFLATKKLVYNMTLWAVEELLLLKDDFKGDDSYWDMIAWTMACLNIVNLSPENHESKEKFVGNMFDLNEVYIYLNKQK